MTTESSDRETILEETESIKKEQQSCFRRCLSVIWTIDDEDSNDEHHVDIRKTFKELIVYIGFLFLVCTISFGTTSSNTFHFSRSMTNLFLDGEDDNGGSFRTITSVSDFWDFALGPLLNGLYWEEWYNGKAFANNATGGILYENRLLGVPRFRQLRVHTNSCQVTEEFKNVIFNCYPDYSMDIEDNTTFGPDYNDNATAWDWQSEEESEDIPYWGKLSVYSGSGFIRDLYPVKSETEDAIRYLKDNLWIDRGTRAVFVLFTVYNANVNLFCIIVLLVEFPTTGGAIPSSSFFTVNFIRYVSNFDYFIMVCEILLCIYILYYAIEEVIEICLIGFKYFMDVWNVLDVTLIVVSIVCIGFNLTRTAMIKGKLDGLLHTPNEYTNFQYLGFWEARFNNAMAIAVFLAWVKTFKYISFNKTLTQLSTTLSRCAKDLMGFFIMFFIVFLAFTQLGYLLFCSKIKNFSTFSNAFFTLFRIILGDFDFGELEQANRILGPIFFTLYVFYVFFILINMFLAIINDTYSEVKSDMTKDTEYSVMAGMVKEGYMKLWDKLAHKGGSKQFGPVAPSEGSESEKTVEYDEWRDDLIKKGYDEERIRAVFEKFDIDKDLTLDPAEQRELRKELDKKMSFGKVELEDHEDAFVHTKKFLTLTRRVDRMEIVLKGAIDHIDGLLSQIADY